MAEIAQNPVFDRAALLQRTPEQIAEDEAAQKEAAAKLQHLVSDSIAVANYKSALGREKAVRRALEKDNLNDPQQAFEQLADALFWQGKFQDAVSFAPTPERERVYRRYLKAFENLDAPLCNCPPIQFPSARSAKGSSVPSKREIQRVFVESLGKEVKFIKCDKCGKLFAQSV